MITDPIAVSEHLAGLEHVIVLGVDGPTAGPLRVDVETIVAIAGCPSCGVVARVKDRDRVELADLT